MVKSPSRCSFPRRAPIDFQRVLRVCAWTWVLATCTACGRADDVVPADSSVAAAATTAATASEPAATPVATAVLCQPSGEGYLRALLKGSIDTELDWSTTPQCLGAPRPSGDGVRLLFKGPVKGSDGAALLIVIGAGPLDAGESRRQVPANITVIREGSGEFFATQGDDKCALDEVTQQLLDPAQHRFRLTARGYCTQPARAVRGDGAVLVSRFDVESVVDYSETASPPTIAEAAR
jgi:hypothetical protein